MNVILVMGTHTRAFNRIFELAQKKLRNTFGMELAELPSRAGLDQENNNEEENEARKATGTKKKGWLVDFFRYIRSIDINQSLFFIYS